MMKGTLWKSTEAYASSMERRYCVLVGTLMLDFESADDFENGAPARAEGQVIGASVWRGMSNRDAVVLLCVGGRLDVAC